MEQPYMLLAYSVHTMSADDLATLTIYMLNFSEWT